MESNEEDEVLFDQPTTFTERREIAQSCAASLALTMPCVVDDMENTVDEAYCAWPERLFVVDVEGRIAQAGMQGPFGFEPSEVKEWLRGNVGKPRSDATARE